MMSSSSHHRRSQSEAWSGRRSCGSAGVGGDDSLDLSYKSKSSSSSSMLLKQHSSCSNNNTERRISARSMSMGSSYSAGLSASRGDRVSTIMEVGGGGPDNNNNSHNKAVVHACDKKGRCIFHPHVQLRKKTIMGVVGGWKDIRRYCPDCERQEFMEKLIARETNEIKQMERILDQMDQLGLERLNLNVNNEQGQGVSSPSRRGSQISKGSGSSRGVQIKGKQHPQRQGSNVSKEQQKKQQSHLHSASKETSQRRRRQRTLSPRDRRSSDGQPSRQRTLSPRDRRSSDGKPRRQKTLTPRDRSNSDGQSRRDRTLSPRPRDRRSSGQPRRNRTLSPRDRASDGQPRRQRTLSPRDRNNVEQPRKQKTLSLNKDRNNAGQPRRNSTLSPRDRNRDGRSRRQRTLSPNKDRNNIGHPRRNRTLSPRDRNSDGRSRRQRTLFPKKDRIESLPPSLSTKTNDSDSSDDDSSSSSSSASSFQQKQRNKIKMWKEMSKMLSRDTRDGTRAGSDRMRNDSGGTHHEYCQLHPTMRMRNDKCALCYDIVKAFEARKAKEERERGMKIKSDGGSCGGYDNIDAKEDGVSARDSVNNNDISGGSTEYDDSRNKQLMDHTTEEESAAYSSLAKSSTANIEEVVGDIDDANATGKLDNDNAELVGGEQSHQNLEGQLQSKGVGESEIKVNKETTPSDGKFSTARLDSVSSSSAAAAVEEKRSLTPQASIPKKDESSSARKDESRTSAGSNYSRSKAAIRSTDVVEVEDVDSGSEEDDEEEKVTSRSRTVAQHRSQPKASCTIKTNEEEGLNVNNSKDRRVTVESSARTSVAETATTISLSHDRTLNGSLQTEDGMVEPTSVSHKHNNGACRDPLSATSHTSTAEIQVNTNMTPQQHSSVLENQQTCSNQRRSRSKSRSGVSNRQRSRSRSRSVESIPFFAALVENARSRLNLQHSRSQSVNRNNEGIASKGDKKSWTSRSRSVQRSGGDEPSSSKEKLLVSKGSRSRSIPWRHSFTRKTGKVTNEKKAEEGERSRSRKGKGDETGSAEKNDHEPIAHPRYALGDVARDEDMIRFPKSSHKSSGGRRRRGKDNNETSNSDEDQDKLNESKFIASVKELRNLDAAFVRRSDGRWTYALVANVDDDGIIFVVDKQGSTKTLANKDTWKWKKSVRRIKVLTEGRGTAQSQSER